MTSDNDFLEIARKNTALGAYRAAAEIYQHLAACDPRFEHDRAIALEFLGYTLAATDDMYERLRASLVTFHQATAALEQYGKKLLELEPPHLIPTPRPLIPSNRRGARRHRRGPRPAAN